MRRGKWGKGGNWGRGGRGGRHAPALLLLLVMAAALFMLLENTLAPPLLAAAEDQARTRALTALTAAAGRQIEKNGADDYRHGDGGKDVHGGIRTERRLLSGHNRSGQRCFL